MSLDFGYDLRIDGEQIIFQRDFLPPELLKLCGSLGVGIYLSLYPPQITRIEKYDDIYNTSS